ncbi:hypothetical protein QA639_21645 [Bradyrhizobium pachyrhizi]|uniref:hypothetical protein n=1 Tax=Bradyrhizobium pachyrhizi TaxID=280333 RepID=UPI0024B2368A|nr:hypothetical protein [Bradyrhizobium pachyrhizi]WFU52313.1 hypothetical protein QA639_21645 [Bradyrhizobium pachyrhizi]
MPQYIVDKEIWLAGLKQPVGKVVTLTEGQAKYLGHALSKAEDKPAAPAAPAKKAKTAAAPAAGAVVTETPADGAAN